MTGTIEDGFGLSDEADPLRPDGTLPLLQVDELPDSTEATALIEQAKGVLIFRYSIGAGSAFRLLERWSKEATVSVDTVARVLVHEICQGDRTRPANPRFVRWLEERLRQEFQGEPYDMPEALPSVKVAVDHSDCSLDAVVEAARRAWRRCVPLEVTVEARSLQGAQREQTVQRVRLAEELAHAVAPGLDVRLPEGVPSVGT